MARAQKQSASVNARPSTDVLRGVREIARFLRVRDSAAAELVRSGAIPSRKVGRATLVSRRAALSWLEMGEKEAVESWT